MWLLIYLEFNLQSYYLLSIHLICFVFPFYSFLPFYGINQVFLLFHFLLISYPFFCYFINSPKDCHVYPWPTGIYPKLVHFSLWYCIYPTQPFIWLLSYVLFLYIFKNLPNIIMKIYYYWLKYNNCYLDLPYIVHFQCSLFFFLHSPL